MYQIYSIKKKNSGYRTIFNPLLETRILQKELVKQLESRYTISDYCFAYRKGISPVDLTKKILDSKWLIKLDIQNFFPSIKKHHLLSLGFSEEECKIALYKDFLVEGSLSSPFISNLVIGPILEEINAILGSDIRVYSYSDDIVISSAICDKPSWKYVFLVEEVLNKNGFKLNRKKTKFMFPNNKLEVLGITLNSGVPTINKKRIKNKLKYDAISEDQKNGWISYVRGINMNQAKGIQNATTRK